jgi:hypothetical protein
MVGAARLVTSVEEADCDNQLAGLRDSKHHLKINGEDRRDRQDTKCRPRNGQ